MTKLSVSLPDSTLITLESEETGLLHDVLRMVLENVQSHPAADGMAAPVYLDGEDGKREKGTDAAFPQPASDAAAPRKSANGVAAAHPSNGTLSYGEPAASAIALADFGDDKLDLGRYRQESRDGFTAFCQSINPTGDMRRVVVAAEAASRFFGLDGVTADELGELFDLAGWRRANSFTQTIRNAARAKFRWLERIPGRSGRYAATDFGRATTLSGSG